MTRPDSHASFLCDYLYEIDNDNDNDNGNMFITTDIYSISETNARHKYIGKSIKQ